VLSLVGAIADESGNLSKPIAPFPVGPEAGQIMLMSPAILRGDRVMVNLKVGAGTGSGLRGNPAIALYAPPEDLFIFALQPFDGATACEVTLGKAMFSLGRRFGHLVHALGRSADGAKLPSAGLCLNASKAASHLDDAMILLHTACREAEIRPLKVGDSSGSMHVVPTGRSLARFVGDAKAATCAAIICVVQVVLLARIIYSDVGV